MKKLIIMFSICLTACAPVSPAEATQFSIPSPLIAEIPTGQPSLTNEEYAAPTTTSNILPELTPEALPFPYYTPLPVQKSYSLRYIQGGGDGVDEILICLAGYAPYPRLVLYDDGQLILFRQRSGFVETVLSGNEIKDLFAQIERTGFFDLRITRGSVETTGVYDLPPGIEYREGGWEEGISVRGEDIWIIPGLWDYAVQPIKDTVSILRSYEPKGTSLPYIPSKVQLYVLDAGNEEVIKDFGNVLKPLPAVMTWPSQLPRLVPGMGENVLQKTDIVTAVGLHLFSKFPDVKVFRQDSREYIVVACPAFDLWW